MYSSIIIFFLYYCLVYPFKMAAEILIWVFLISLIISILVYYKISIIFSTLLLHTILLFGLGGIPFLQSSLVQPFTMGT